MTTNRRAILPNLDPKCVVSNRSWVTLLSTCQRPRQQIQTRTCQRASTSPTTTSAAFSKGVSHLVTRNMTGQRAVEKNRKTTSQKFCQYCALWVEWSGANVQAEGKWWYFFLFNSYSFSANIVVELLSQLTLCVAFCCHFRPVNICPNVAQSANMS